MDGGICNCEGALWTSPGPTPWSRTTRSGLLERCKTKQNVTKGLWDVGLGAAFSLFGRQRVTTTRSPRDTELNNLQPSEAMATRRNELHDATAASVSLGLAVGVVVFRFCFSALHVSCCALLFASVSASCASVCDDVRA